MRGSEIVVSSSNPDFAKVCSLLSDKRVKFDLKVPSLEKTLVTSKVFKKSPRVIQELVEKFELPLVVSKVYTKVKRISLNF